MKISLMTKKVLSVAGAITTIAAVVILCFKANAYVAKNHELQAEIKERVLLAMRLDNKIIMDKIDYWIKRKDAIYEKYEGRTMPPEAIERIKDIEAIIKELERQLQEGS